MPDHALRNEKNPTSCRDYETAGGMFKADSLAHDLSDCKRSSKASDATVNPDSDVLVVDWDGPDDPSNPKK